eukprot:6197535-Pleurochrysis_carterae.AAC.2
MQAEVRADAIEACERFVDLETLGYRLAALVADCRAYATSAKLDVNNLAAVRTSERYASASLVHLENLA